ncbi:WD domain, g-beta repeat domain-containing protein [Phthorimaea operculella]|nr:WD domain, g-beta repeat domain-containing protein [Phthorimaea operculella]
MVPSHAICVSQEGPANALALNKDCTQVVIAGRNVYKVFAIGENEFTEVCNLRVGKNLNLNFSSIDVAWSTIEENTLATAATNGAVVVWNLGRSGRSKQEHVFSDHKRTVNKVSFHLTEPALLISGSQDGMMKCFDLRMKEVARTFISNTESIRDVQFSPHAPQTFAAVSENGSVQVWDVRKADRPLQQFTAHSGPVFACDWHPELPWLATASRDKTIKVWDMTAKPNLEHTIYTIASVGHVKWRPQKKYQVASCALVMDCFVHVWDVRRPHVPLATFAEHRDVTTAIAWQASPHAFLSTSRDCSLYRHRFTEAAHPVLWANPQGVCISARGDIAHATPERPLPALATSNTSATDRHASQLGRKQPTQGSLSASAQAALERAFPGGAMSTLVRLAFNNERNPFLACAKEYKIKGKPTHELAAHNATVARKHNRALVAHVWDVIELVYSARAADEARAPAPPRAPPPPHPAPHPPAYHTVEEEPIEEIEEWAENQFHNSGVLGMPTHSIYIPPAKFAKCRGSDDDDPGWVSAASAHYVDIDAADWTLPEEAFPLRTAPPPPPPPPADNPTHPHLIATHSSEDKDTDINTGPGVSPGGTSSSPSSGSNGSTTSANTNQPQRQFSYNQQQSSSSTEEGGSLSIKSGEYVFVRPKLDLSPIIAKALKQHADLGDVQTACVVMLVLGEHRADLFPYIDESLQEQWLLGYIELLQRFKLWNEATEVIRCAWLAGVWALSQQSTSITVCCGRCGRRTKPHQACERCTPKQKPDICAVCHKVVMGLYAWCQGCAHGGHLIHMKNWMEKHTLCPAGCGHQCTLGL